jgi:Predicted membrane-bound mannosyltransferase
MGKRSQEKIVEEQAERPVEEPRFDIGWLVSCAVITAIATGLRFVVLGLKPFHHDEGVNGWFLTTLFRDGTYKYDPANYHGPTLYYISLAFTKVFGLQTLPLRWSVAVWGVLMVVLIFWLRKYIGKVGSLFAALLLALSPGMVFISRYFIHEIFFVFLALAVVVAVVQFIERETAGKCAIVWTGILLLVCFFPSTFRLASLIADEGTTSLLALKIGFFLVELVLVMFVLRMLMAWRDGRPIYFLLASASVSLMFATKETGFISLGTMLIAIVCVMLWEKIEGLKAIAEKPVNRMIAILILPVLAAAYYYEAVWDGVKWINDHLIQGGDHISSERYLIVVLLTATVAAFVAFVVRSSQDPAVPDGYESPSWTKFNAGMGDGIDLVLILVTALVVFIYIWILFFTSFFTYQEGIGRSIEAYNIWTKTGSKDHTQNGTFGYLKWGMQIESPLLILSALGLLIALVRGKHRFALFAGFWAFGLFLAYTIIPYKTPWLMLSFLLPMAISGGYAINELAGSKAVLSRISAVVLAVLACVILAWQTYDLNFVNYDNDRKPYVYAHTSREYLSMLAEIEKVAERSGQGKQTRIQIVSPDYWPLVWELREYPNAGFHGRIVDAGGAEVIIAKKNGQEADAMRKYSGEYEFFASYKLRPGVDLSLFVRKDLVR